MWRSCVITPTPAQTRQSPLHFARPLFIFELRCLINATHSHLTNEIGDCRTRGPLESVGAVVALTHAPGIAYARHQRSGAAFAVRQESARHPHAHCDESAWGRYTH